MRGTVTYTIYILNAVSSHIYIIANQRPMWAIEYKFASNDQLYTIKPKLILYYIYSGYI